MKQGVHKCFIYGRSRGEKKKGKVSAGTIREPGRKKRNPLPHWEFWHSTFHGKESKISLTSFSATEIREKR